MTDNEWESGKWGIRVCKQIFGMLNYAAYHINNSTNRLRTERYGYDKCKGIQRTHQELGNAL